MSQTATASVTTTDATPVTSAPRRHRGQAVPAIALGVATFAAILSVIAITTDATDSGTPSQPVVHQQNPPAAGQLSRTQVVVNLDACGRPIIAGRLACR
ncbi:MAG: hypothetical protein ABWY68_05195 [Cryobacterium sp.]